MYQMYRKIVTTIAWALCAIRDFMFSIWLILRKWYRADKSDEFGDTALMEAAAQGHTETVKTLIEAGADVNQVDNNGKTALMKAARGGHTEIVKALIEAGVDVDAKDNTALIEAALRGYSEIVKALIAAGVDVNKTNDNGCTALIAAVQGRQTEMVKALIALGADVNQVDNNGDTALIWAAYWGKSEIVKFLIVLDADVNRANKDGRTALMWAAAQGHTETVKTLIAARADIHKTDNYGNTALMKASQEGHSELVNVLIAASVDIHKTNNEGETVLMAAFMYVPGKGHTEMVKDLIEAGADVNKTNNHGQTVLMRAAYWGRSEAVRILIAAGADVNRADKDGNTALMRAAYWGRSEAVRILIAAGADVNKTNNHGQTVLMRAAYWGRSETVRILIAAGADVNQADNEGNTALIGAAYWGRSETVRILIAAGADVNRANKYGSTALMFAELREHGEIITVIKDFKTAYPTIIAIQESRMRAWNITAEHVQEKTDAGYTTLMAVCARDDLALVENLLKYGADIYAQDTYGRTALSCAHSTTMVMDFIKNYELDNLQLNIPAALGSIHSAHAILERAVQQNNRDLIELILRNVPKLVESSSNVLSLSNDITGIRLLLHYGIRPPSNSVLQPHIQQEVIIQHILASAPWSYAQRLTMSVGDVKAWMRNYADMLPKANDHIYHISAIDQETVQKIQACKDDTMKATEFLRKDDHLLYTVYCAKVVRKMKEGEMSLSTKTLVSLIESKIYLEHGYVEHVLNSLIEIETPEEIDEYTMCYRTAFEKDILRSNTLYEWNIDDPRLLEFLRRCIHEHITIAPEKNKDYQVLLELTHKITAGASDDVDKSIKELITKAEAFGKNKDGVEGVFSDWLVGYIENWSMNNHVVSHTGMFSGHTAIGSNHENAKKYKDPENNFSLVL